MRAAFEIGFGGCGGCGAVVSDKALKVNAGCWLVQVGKRKFARVTVSP